MERISAFDLISYKIRKRRRCNEARVKPRSNKVQRLSTCNRHFYVPVAWDELIMMLLLAVFFSIEHK